MLATAGMRVTMLVANDMRHDSRVRRAAAALAAEGHAVTVFGVLSEATADRAEELVDGYTIIRVPMLSRPVTTDGHGAATAGPRSRRRLPGPRQLAASAFVASRPVFGGTLHLLLTWRLRWRAWGVRVQSRAQPADVWHAHDLNTLETALACARRHGGRVVYDSHEIFTEAGAAARLPAAVRRTVRRLERGMAQSCDAVVTVNESIATHLEASLGVPNVHVVHNCATPPIAGPSPLRDAVGVPPGTTLVLYHGSVTVGRGLETLVDAMADSRLATAHLAIMGYGPLRPALQERAAHSPAAGRIHFLAPVAPPDVTRWVAGADVAAMPIQPTTLNHRLSSPNKLFEALAAGVPIVGPDYPEFRRILTDGQGGTLGRLHVGHDVGDVATAIADLAALPPRAMRRLRAACRRAAIERWSWDHERPRLLAIYDGLRAGALISSGSTIRRGHPLRATARVDG